LGESLTIEVRNDRKEIAPAIEMAEVWLQERRAPPKVVYFVALAIEELVLNCIRYGYIDDKEHAIFITLTVSDEMLTMLVVDDGRAFDPLMAPVPDFTVNIRDRRAGRTRNTSHS
jgi:serine/threonine-protein kinase RsbW